MTQEKNWRKCIGIVVALVLTGMLTGCGENGEKTANAVALMKDLNYQGALTELDAAMEAGENQRLVERYRGIAYMGLTEYGQAAEAFLNSLAGSNGFVL